MGRGGDDFHSPDVQLAAMRRAIVPAGLQEVGIIDDIDQTGRTFNRKGINKIRAMVAAKQIDAIAVYDVSRLGRNVRESLTFLGWLADHGIAIVSACEQLDTSTPAGRLMLTNMLAIAEYRSDEIGRAWSASIARRAAAGGHHGHPLGYRREAKKMVPDPVLGPAIADVFKRFARGEPTKHICQTVSEARGREVAPSVLRKLLRSPVYLGHVTADGKIVSHDAHPPLVDQHTFDRVQARLDRTARTPSRTLEATWSLVGLTYCPAGHHLYRHPNPYRGEIVNRLQCERGRRSVGKCEGVGSPRLDLVEAEVLQQVARYISRLRTNDAERAAVLARQQVAVVDAAKLRRELDRTLTAISTMAKAWALGDLSADEYHRPVAELRAEAATLRARLADLGTPEEQPTPVEAANAAEAMLGLWPHMTIEERNRSLRSLRVRVVVRKAARYREPEAFRVSVELA